LNIPEAVLIVEVFRWRLFELEFPLRDPNIIEALLELLTLFDMPGTVNVRRPSADSTNVEPKGFGCVEEEDAEEDEPNCPGPCGRNC